MSLWFRVTDLGFLKITIPAPCSSHQSAPSWESSEQKLLLLLASFRQLALTNRGSALCQTCFNYFPPPMIRFQLSASKFLSLSLAWELIWSWDEFALPSHFDTLAPKQTIDQSNFSQNFSRAARKSVFDTFDIFGLDPQTNLWLLLFSDTSWTNPDPSFEDNTRLFWKRWSL